MSARPPAQRVGLARFLNGLRHALRGFGFLLHTQPNARVHLVATIVVTAAGFGCEISRGEWLAVTLAIGLVWTAEGLNTAIEAIVDLVSPEQHPLAGRAKDVAAGAVLCAAVGAGCVGLLIFGPRVLALLFR